MEELVINGQTYEFKFGIGFLRDMNKMIAVPVKEVPGMKKDVGFNYYAAEMLGGFAAGFDEKIHTLREVGGVFQQRKERIELVGMSGLRLLLKHGDKPVRHAIEQDNAQRRVNPARILAGQKRKALEPRLKEHRLAGGKLHDRHAPHRVEPAQLLFLAEIIKKRLDGRRRKGEVNMLRVPHIALGMHASGAKQSQRASAQFIGFPVHDQFHRPRRHQGKLVKIMYLRILCRIDMRIKPIMRFIAVEENRFRVDFKYSHCLLTPLRQIFAHQYSATFRRKQEDICPCFP